jgi:hypothetical protein
MLQCAAVQIDRTATVQENTALICRKITVDLTGLTLASITHINIS